MTRLLLLLGVIAVFWYLVESRLRAVRRHLEALKRAQVAARGTGAAAPAEILVRCIRCGTYIPQSRARLDDGGACCQAGCASAAAPSG